MPVGKGSIARVAKAKAESNPEVVTPAEPVQKKPAVQRKKTSSIHEKKFEAVSKIHCDLPVHLL